MKKKEGDEARGKEKGRQTEMKDEGGENGKQAKGSVRKEKIEKRGGKGESYKGKRKWKKCGKEK